MIYITDKNGLRIARSKNLRGILARNSKLPVSDVTIHSNGRPPGGAILYVEWSDGSRAHAVFADVDVCIDWCNRRRAFSGVITHKESLP